MTLLETLNPESKLDLISKLAQSLKTEVISKENRMESSFGAWVEDGITDDPYSHKSNTHPTP
jgi:hypothetical protein